MALHASGELCWKWQIEKDRQDRGPLPGDLSRDLCHSRILLMRCCGRFGRKKNVASKQKGEIEAEEASSLGKTNETKQNVGPKKFKARIGNCISTKVSEDNLS